MAKRYKNRTTEELLKTYAETGRRYDSTSTGFPGRWYRQKAKAIYDELGTRGIDAPYPSKKPYLLF